MNCHCQKFAKKPEIAEANIKVIHAGYDYGHNTHASVAHTYKIESKIKTPGIYMDIMGNKATAYGFIAAAEKAVLIPSLRLRTYYMNSPNINP